MSVLDGPSEGTWSVFATKVAEERDEARAALQRIAALMQCEPDDDDDLTEAVRLLVSERNEARAEVERMRERIATQEDGLRYGEQVCARLVAERDEALQKERERCARICDLEFAANWHASAMAAANAAKRCAGLIREQEKP